MKRKLVHKEFLEILLLAAIIVLIVSVLWQSYLRALPRQVGSFEYVRRGEALLDKNNFSEAIKLFERARASSPKNETIVSVLADAYSKYGKHLAGSKEYIKATEYCKKAYATKPSSRTMQELAIMYAKRAVMEARNNPADAKIYFENARLSAADSAIASRNLSISLFNDAVAESKAGRDDLAIVFLKESSLAYMDSSAFELMGDIYYKNADFEKARFYFGRALVLDSLNRNIRNKLRKTVREIALAKTAEVEEFSHFEIRYDKGMSIDTDAVQRLLEKCYIDVGGDFKYFPDTKTTVLFYSHGNFKDIFKLSSQAQAFYDGSIRVPLPDRALSRHEFADRIRHEYTHAVVYAKTNNNCPVWLNEGIAVWEEYKNKDVLISRIFARVVDQKKLSLAWLATAFDLKSEDPNELRMRYLLSYSVVEYIIDNWGLVGMRNLLGRIKEGRHVMNAVEDEFLLSEKEFERLWRSYVVRKYFLQ